MDKIWLITAVILHLFGDDILEAMKQRYVLFFAGPEEFLPMQIQELANYLIMA